ncbi:MAG: hypothetical protein RBS39_10110 [Phycisphaerales bacterium]|jgi:hypothetical protein|nr:hypothetical protein [Phycisphaerales bacterium]
MPKRRPAFVPTGLAPTGFARTAIVLALSAGVVGLASVTLLAQPATPAQAQPAGQPQGQPGRGRAPGGGFGFNPMELVGALKQTEGCLGVELAGTMGGKRSIIAWFKDPESVKRWYRSDTHQRMMGEFAKGAEGHQPLAHIGDYAGPVMVMATITPSDKAQLDGVELPISQISIELYAPLPGGAFVGGRLAPEGFEVPHMRDYTPKDGGAE